MDARERFERKVAPPDENGCRAWLGATNRGYGTLHFRGRMRGAHVVAWMLSGREVVGRILHSCDNPLCVALEHLRDGSAQDNMDDMARRDRGTSSTGALPYGVKKVFGSSRFAARGYKGGRHIWLGTFATIDEAARVAREAKAQRLGMTFGLLLLVWPVSLSAQTITGIPRIIDGDTLEVQGQRIRLHGVDAPELSQTCTRKGFTYHCGAVTLVRLEALVSGRPVTCAPSGRDRYERVVARCYVGDPHIDLGGWLVREGLAVAYTKYSTDYLPQESVARGARLGLWSGAFVPPAEWRRGKR